MRTPHALLTIALLTFIPAAKADCTKGVGEAVKRTLTVDALHGIALEGSMDVVLTQGPVQSVEVEAQANLIDLLRTDVRNGVWTIETKDGFTTNKPFIVRITVPVIDQVTVDGSGNVMCNGRFKSDAMELAIAGSGNITINFDSPQAQASIAGSGDMTLAGTCTKLTVAVAGSGDVNATALKTADATVDIAGSGDVSLDASQSLEASIAGSGDVSYKGRPTSVKRNVMGSGEVRSLERGPR